jgi:hypothetical protein
VYRGTAKGALFEGTGKLATREGLYTGQFRQGKRCGKGTHVSKGCSYRGHWLDDRYEGRGVLHYAREHDAFKGLICCVLGFVSQADFILK